MNTPFCSNMCMRSLWVFVQCVLFACFVPWTIFYSHPYTSYAPKQQHQDQEIQNHNNIMCFDTVLILLSLIWSTYIHIWCLWCGKNRFVAGIWLYFWWPNAWERTLVYSWCTKYVISKALVVLSHVTAPMRRQCWQFARFTGYFIRHNVETVNY